MHFDSDLLPRSVGVYRDYCGVSIKAVRSVNKKTNNYPLFSMYPKNYHTIDKNKKIEVKIICSQCGTEGDVEIKNFAYNELYCPKCRLGANQYTNYSWATSQYSGQIAHGYVWHSEPWVYEPAKERLVVYTNTRLIDMFVDAFNRQEFSLVVQLLDGCTFKKLRGDHIFKVGFLCGASEFVSTFGYMKEFVGKRLLVKSELNGSRSGRHSSDMPYNSLLFESNLEILY